MSKLEGPIWEKSNLTLEEAASVIAAPFWSTIEAKTDLEDKAKHLYLRTVFPSLLVTGPFSIVMGFTGGLMALNLILRLDYANTEYLSVYAFVWQFDVVSDDARDTLKATHIPEARRDLTVGGVGLALNF